MQSNVLKSVILPNSILKCVTRNYARRINSRRVTNRFSERKIQDVKNPGLQNQMNVLYDKHEIKDLRYEDLEDLETDFMESGKAQKLHESEIEAFKEKQKLWIVGRKYFKESKVNFLTWNDKEQIRHLHQSNPEEWTIEKLSEGFPALPSTIAKLLKINWRPHSENRIKNHDKNVENNWKLLNEGKLNHLPSEMIQHALKFSKRTPNTKIEEEKIIIRQHNVQKRPGEYSSIIENYQKLVNEKHQKNPTENFDPDENFQQETKELHSNIPLLSGNKNEKPDQKKDRRLITLDDLKKEIESKIDKRKNVDEYEKMIVLDSKKGSEEKSSVVDSTRIGGLQTFKVETNKKVLMSVDEQKLAKALSYPEKIKIPKEKWKKGFTYKVNDCFYDDDGEFLYRVPGMN